MIEFCHKDILNKKTKITCFSFKVLQNLTFVVLSFGPSHLFGPAGNAKLR